MLNPHPGSPSAMRSARSPRRRQGQSRPPWQSDYRDPSRLNERQFGFFKELFDKPTRSTDRRIFSSKKAELAGGAAGSPGAGDPYDVAGKESVDVSPSAGERMSVVPPIGAKARSPRAIRRYMEELQRAKALEKGWNTRAHVTASQNNGRMSPPHREMFDSPRDFDETTPGIRPRRVDGFVRSPTGEYTPTAFAERTASRGAEVAAGSRGASGRNSPPALGGGRQAPQAAGKSGRSPGGAGQRGLQPQHSPIRRNPGANGGAAQPRKSPRSRSRRQGAQRGAGKRPKSPAARAAYEHLLRSERRRREQEETTAAQ